MTETALRVTVWNEYVHEREDDRIRAVYPDGIHEVIAAALREHLGEQAAIRTATLDQPDHGLGDEALQSTDVLTWWGHKAHGQVSDDVVDRVQRHVLDGMGLVVLHSGHYSKIFRRLMGTTCALRWREADDREVVWTVNPAHPIAAGVPHPFVIPRQEMYGEFFDVPQPDELVFISSFTGGEVFRSGCCFTRGWGRIFYFSPGHESYPIYYQPEVQQIIANAVRWAGGTGARRAEAYEPVNSPGGWYDGAG